MTRSNHRIAVRRTRYRRTATVLALGVFVTAGATGTASAQPFGHETALGGQEYVALGDSGAATTGVQFFDPDAPLACAQSTRNTPKLVARKLGLRLDDRTCSSAEIGDLTGRQFGFIPPQFDALGPDTRLVTVHIGANDAATWKSHLACMIAPGSNGTCAAELDNWQARTEAIGPEFGAALSEIHSRAPQARIYVDGWTTYVRDTGCAAALLTPAGATNIQQRYDLLNDVVRREAERAGATYIDTRTPGIGHDSCAGDQRWIEPAIPGDTLVPFHPTLSGMEAIADIIVAAVKATTPSSTGQPAG
ncbi:SGNH/GDSL hydrolase family protein [Nocardia sp. NBC_01388]|uniref:SGNH/GDSL hydrolase family protein n=1 Tax=Nocardia sp. NBC_01388 TaxID=2903596 RepID=UPI003248A0C2